MQRNVLANAHLNELFKEPLLRQFYKQKRKYFLGGGTS